MIEYVIEHSPDNRVLERASNILEQGGVICFPTDTQWVLGACAHQKGGIEKLYKIKNEGHHKHFSILCSDISMASDMAKIGNCSFKLLKKCTPGHYTFIFEATKKIAKYIQASKTDKEVGIRIIPSVLVNKLIKTHGHPIVCTSVTNKMAGLENESTDDIYSYMLEETISNQTQMIIDPGEFEFVGPSTMVNLSIENEPELLREGAGDASIF